MKFRLNYKKILRIVPPIGGLLILFSTIYIVSAQIGIQENDAVYTGPKILLAEKIEIPHIIVGTTTIPDYLRIDLDRDLLLILRNKEEMLLEVGFHH